MAKAKKVRENHISVLLMPDDEGERQVELYYWYDGNPFGLSERRSEILGLARVPAVLYSEPIAEEPREVFNAILQSVGDKVGYLIAKKDFMVVGVPSRRWTRVSHEVLKFFPTQNSVMNVVSDKNMKIGNTASFKKRVKRVRGAEKDFATKQLPEVTLRIPSKDQ